MAQITYPLGMSKELLKEVKHAAEETGLSAADVMRQAIKFGIPRVRQALSRPEESGKIAKGEAEQSPKVRFVKRGRYTVGISDKRVDMKAVRELLAEFP